MKILVIIIILINVLSVKSQQKINLLDENVNSNHTTIILERNDGSIFELNGKAHWTIHKLIPTSKDFAKLVNAKKRKSIEFETIDGTKYSNVNGREWSKSQNRIETKGDLGVSAIYKSNQNLIDLKFKISSVTYIEVSILSLYGSNKFVLHSKNEQPGLHRIQLPTINIPIGEYMLVLRTPQKAETVRLSITN